MKSDQRILRSFAIILLLTFGQKLGAGLYIHNWFHFKNCHQPVPSSANVTSYSCNCVDDFSMPFAEAPEKVSQVVCSVEVEFSPSHKSLISLPPLRFYSLRGPPVAS
jgi:hypothetical protein